MNDDNNGLKALVRAMKKALKDDHGIKVPYSALRASYLQAHGEHPHAFAGKQPKAGKTLLDGDALPSKLIPTQQAKVSSRVSAEATHTLFLAGDELGCLVKLSIDEGGEVLLPEDWDFKGWTLMSQKAQVPRVSKYGLPDYLAYPEKFYKDHATGMALAPDLKSDFKDLGDDSGDSCSLVVCTANSEWLQLLEAVLDANPLFADDVAEWVGLHYRCMFDQQSSSAKAEWVVRYLDSAPSSKANIDVVFEYVYPDEDGGSISASLNLETGKLTLAQYGPARDITGSEMRTRIWVGEEVGEGDDHDVYFRRDDKDCDWALYSGSLDNIRMSQDYLPKAAKTAKKL